MESLSAFLCGVFITSGYAVSKGYEIFDPPGRNYDKTEDTHPPERICDLPLALFDSAHAQACEAKTIAMIEDEWFSVTTLYEYDYVYVYKNVYVYENEHDFDV